MISDLLQVSVDYLLDHNATAVKYVTREAIDIKEYGKGFKKKKTDRAIRAKFPDAEIRTLLPKQKLTKAEKVIDNLLGFAPCGAFGIPDIINSFKFTGEYYLVEQGERQYLAVVADTYIETQELAFRVTDKKFEFGNLIFTLCTYALRR